MKSIALVSIVSGLAALTACNKSSPVAEREQASNTVTLPNAPPGASGAVAITVGTYGYQPDSIHAKAGQPLRLTFTRTSDEGCGQQVVFPSLGIRKDLPLNTAVAVDITVPKSGSLAFTCGMNMYRGSIVAQ